MRPRKNSPPTLIWSPDQPTDRSASQLSSVSPLRALTVTAQPAARALAKGARKFETKEEPSRRELAKALDDSATRIEKFLRNASEGAPGAKTFKRGAIQALAYFVAHESHHRGNILLTLKQCGHPVPQETRYGIWDWDRI